MFENQFSRPNDGDTGASDTGASDGNRAFQRKHWELVSDFVN